MNLSDKDLLFCSKARFKKEIANYLGISVRTLNQWLSDIEAIGVNKGKLFTPREVKIILKECL